MTNDNSDSRPQGTAEAWRYIDGLIFRAQQWVEIDDANARTDGPDVEGARALIQSLASYPRRSALPVDTPEPTPSVEMDDVRGMLHLIENVLALHRQDERVSVDRSMFMEIRAMLLSIPLRASVAYEQDLSKPPRTITAPAPPVDTGDRT